MNRTIISIEVQDESDRKTIIITRGERNSQMMFEETFSYKDEKKHSLRLNLLKERLFLEKPRDFDPFGQTGFAHLWLQYDCPFKVLVLGVNFILPF